jgi:DNA-directed RNA polymerase subunit RPC12/RpoP
MYKCSSCGRSVILIDGKVIRACSCNAAIVANISATAYSVSNFGKKRG